MYAIILTDGEYADAYATLSIFEDKALWDWIHAPVDFGGDSSTLVPLPEGYTDEGRKSVAVTIGSPDNDKAQAISGLLGNRVLVEVDGDDMDEEDFNEEDFNDAYDTAWRKQAKDICDQRGVTDVYEGLWY